MSHRESMRDEQVKVFRMIRPLDPGSGARAVSSYRREQEVAAASQVGEPSPPSG